MTQWKVDDRASSLMMRRFYETVLGKRPGLACPMAKADAAGRSEGMAEGPGRNAGEQSLTNAGLARGEERKAKTTQSANAVHPFEHPYYWAAFVLIGDPN